MICNYDCNKETSLMILISDNFRENYKNFYRGFTPDENKKPNRFLNHLATNKKRFAGSESVAE